MSTQRPEEILDEIFDLLNSTESAVCLEGIARLKPLRFSSKAILARLEHLALHENDEAVRLAALSMLGSDTHRFIRAQTPSLPKPDRQLILGEINTLKKQGILEDIQAEVIQRRYDYDIIPPVSASTPLPDSVKMAASAPVEHPAPPPVSQSSTLAQTLLSETSIKIALYLGALFVVASAVILGALVQAARLPILVTGTLVFGAASLAIRRRLPQPGFALFIVFSFLLPITANVLEESFNLSASASAAYWAAVSLFMAAGWGGSARLFESRLFSVTAFLAFVNAFYRFGDIFGFETEFPVAMAGLATLTALPGVQLLKRWKDSKFALPLFFSAQVMQGIVLIASLVTWGTTDGFTPWNLASIITWLMAAVFFAWSNQPYPFFGFPWLAAAALIPVPWFGVSTYDAGAVFNALLFFGWSAILAIASEAMHINENVRKFSLPILLASAPGFLIAIPIGFDEDAWIGFAILLGVSLTYGGIHTIRPRWLLWSASLIAAIGAYFAFFNLPFLENADVFPGYKLLGAGLTLLSPDIFSRVEFNLKKTWRVPPRVLGAFLILIATLFLVLSADSEKTALCFAILTVFFAAYTFIQRKTIFGYFPAAFLPLAIFYSLRSAGVDAWLPTLNALAVIYFAVGFAIRSKSDWSRMLRGSSLALGTIIAIATLVTQKETGEWYSLGIGALFIAELFLARNGWMEIGAPALFSIAAHGILRNFEVGEFPYHMLAFSLIWLAADLMGCKVIGRTRPLKWPVRGIGALLAFTNGLFLLADGIMNDALPAATCFGFYSVFFLAYSLLYRQPNLGYTFTATLPLFAYFLACELEFTKWLYPIILIAIGYYAAGTIQRLSRRGNGWERTLLFSGLGLGTGISFFAPFIGGLDSSIPVALAATLWAFEAFARRNVWLGFPANALYLLSYFMILIELKVDEPHFFSMGAALLGLIQHYLLTRAGSRRGAFITGMVSQFVLLGTTYIQMFNTGQLGYFVVLFFQSLAVLTYGIVIRSRSLTFFPIGFVVIGVATVIYSTLKGISTVLLIGCTGVILIMLGILAVLMRERITKFGGQLNDWRA
jgi:hypothetical protein